MTLSEFIDAIRHAVTVCKDGSVKRKVLAEINDLPDGGVETVPPDDRMAFLERIQKP